MTPSFTERLARRIEGGMAPGCVGLDPRVAALPAGLAPTAPEPERIVAFHREVLPLVARFVPVVKPNVAFYERFGAAGYAAYEETCRLARQADLLVLGDVKRGDVGSTAAAYAEAHFRLADAVTVHGFLGRDSVEPFLAGCRDLGKGLFVLVRTSNPGAEEFQSLATAEGTVSDALARAVDRWGAETGDAFGFSAVGAVVGATWPAELARLRGLMPRAWLLLPGVGAQGARVADCAAAFDPRGLGALVSQSRSVLQCFPPDAADWRDRIEAALTAFAAELRGRSDGAPSPSRP